MINHNELLRTLFEQTISVKYQGTDWAANYSEADLHQLWKVLQSSKQKYPLIWLQTGYSVRQDIRGQKTYLENLRFFFITLGSTNDFYKKRFVDTFQEVLYPLLDGFLDKIKKARGVSFSREQYIFTTLPFNDVSQLQYRYSDYGNKVESQTTTLPDIWDAIVLDVSLTLDNECQNIKPFKIK